MSMRYHSVTRTVCHDRTYRVQDISDLFAVVAFSNLGLVASLLFVISGGQIAL